MAGMTGFQGGMLGLALAAVAAGVAQHNPAPGEPVQPAAQAATPQTATPAMTQVPPAVALMDGSLLDLTRPGGGDSAEVPLFVINRDAAPVRVAFEIALSDSATGRDTSYAAPVEPATVGARRVQVLQLRIPPGWREGDGIQRGYLTMTADNGTAPPALAPPRQIRIAPAGRAPWVMDLLLGFGFGLGIAVVVVAWMSKRIPQEAPALTWSRESWASNLAIVGSALVTFSGLAAPNVVFHHMSRTQYTSLAALVSGVIVLANAFYAFTGAERGTARNFPLALGLVLSATLGAAFSQLIILGMLVREAYEASILTSGLYVAISLVVAGTGLALFVYGVRTVGTLSDAASATLEGVAKRSGGRAGSWPLP